MTAAMRVLGVVLVLWGAGGVAWGEQKHMENALDLLQRARNQLEQASADKGGHRQKAMDRIDEAIEQVRKGIEYARDK